MAPFPGGHDGEELDDLATLVDQIDRADVDEVESTPFREGVVASLHHHLNAVVWGGAEVDVERFAYVVRLLDDRGAHQLSAEIERVMRLATDGGAWPAHDLLAEMEARLSSAS